MSPLNLHIISTDNVNTTTNTINGTYPNNQDKIWQFLIPRGCRMVVYFALFNLEISEMCQNDNFTVQYEKDQQNIHRYCNSLRELKIRKRRVQMKFHSNDAITRGGIKAHVCLTSDNKKTDDKLPCNCVPNGGRRKRAPSTGRYNKHIYNILFHYWCCYLFSLTSEVVTIFIVIIIVFIYYRIQSVKIWEVIKVLQKNKGREGTCAKHLLTVSTCFRTRLCVFKLAITESRQNRDIVMSHHTCLNLP